MSDGARSGHEGPQDDTTRVSAIAAGVLGAAFTAFGFALGGPKTGLSIAVGAGLAVANLLTMRAIIGALLTPADGAEGRSSGGEEPDGAPTGDPVAEVEAEGAAQAEKDPSLDGEATRGPSAREDASKRHGRLGGAAWGMFALLKILVLFGGIGLLLMRGWVEAIPLVIGYGVLPLGITASTVLSALRPRPPTRRR